MRTNQKLNFSHSLSKRASFFGCCCANELPRRKRTEYQPQKAKTKYAASGRGINPKEIKIRFLMKLIILLFTLMCFFGWVRNLNAQTLQVDSTVHTATFEDIHLKNKIIPLNNPVYKILEHYEASGKLDFLPQAKPYTKIFVLKMLDLLTNNSNNRLTEKEKKVINNHIDDLSRESNGFQIYKQTTKKNTFAIVGFETESSVGTGVGTNATLALSMVAKPYFSGDLGNHLTFHASMGAAIEKLAPDLFYQSYTKDGKVNFPFQSIGHSSLPYQFNYETMWLHVLASENLGNGEPVKDKLSAGMIYYTELNGNWFDGAFQLSMNNQRRAWGHDENNLVLSTTARRFPGIELKIEPTSWIRYSLLTGSLFSYANQYSSYKKDIYGYDLGDSQNLFTLHLLEFTPTKWLQISASAGNVWSKRLEISYLMPFVFSNFSEVEVGDYDNLSMSLDIAFRIPKVGKTWVSFYNDEFNFTAPGPSLRLPRNRYAWQLGLKSPLLSGLIPGTSSTLKYTRVTPFVYTHYPESRFNTFTSRPLDMTYTNDGFNLGFYLPPNSAELNWSLVNIAIPDLILSLDNRMIVHGTNDLASSNVYQIYGDVYRYQLGDDILKYPLLNFLNDGIYDWSVLSNIKFDWKVRKIKLMGLNYFRLTGNLGASHTWWESNNSGVVAPTSKTFFTGSMGIVIDI